MEQTTRFFSRSMGRWLMALLLVMLTSLATRAAEAYANYTPSDNTLTFYYDNYRSSRTGTTYDLNTGSIWPGWYIGGISSSVTKVVFDPWFSEARPTSTIRWFFGMRNLTSITGMKQCLNTSSVTNMEGMFSDCRGLTSLDVSGFNTAKVTDMSGMFSGCRGLTSLDVSGFNTAKVTDMGSMFYDCRGLTSLDVSGFNTDKVTDMSYMFGYCGGLTSLDVSGFNTTNVTNMAGMFEFCARLTSLDLSSFNTANVTNMVIMFGYCNQLTSLDLSGFNTAKVTNMQSMFYDCNGLTTIYAGGGWTTDAVTSSNDMFSYCTSLVGGQGTTFDASHIDKAYARIDGGTASPGYFTKGSEAYACYESSDNTLTFYYDDQRSSRQSPTYDLNTGANSPEWVIDGTYTNVTEVVFDPSFAGARPTTTFSWFASMMNLTYISDMRQYLNTSQVTDMSYMFYDCRGLTSLDVRGFNTANVTTMGSMFFRCTGLTSLDLSSFNTAQVTNMAAMFGDCSGLRKINAGSGWKTDAVAYSNNMFYNCTSLVGGQGTTYDANHTNKAYAHIDGGPSNPGYLSPPIEAYANYTPSNKTLMFYYDSSRSSRTGTTYDLNTGSDSPAWVTDGIDVTTVDFHPYFAEARPTTTSYWFFNMPNLTTIRDMRQYLNTSEVTDMSYMFYNCSALTSLNLSGFNTANVTNMQAMFFGCNGLTSLDVSSFNTAKVTDMSGMFDRCRGLTSINLSGFSFNTANVTDMSNMFYFCSALTSLNLSRFNTDNVIDMSYMFFDCHGLTSLDVSSFNTANVTNMHAMFDGCSSLTSLDLRGFNTARVTNMANMFHYCSALTTIYARSGWTTDAVTSSNYMFTNCTSLVGGQGTTYSSGHVDKAYAHIDGGPSNPGYLTELKEAYACYTPSNTTLTFYYDIQRYMRSSTGTTYDLNAGNYVPGWHRDDTHANVTKVVFDPSFADARPTSTEDWFSAMRNLSSITGMKEYLNTSEVTYMGYMFASCEALTSLDVSGFNTSQVTSMRYMFSSCSGLTSLDLSSFNTGNVTSMSGMFDGCTGLRSLDVSSFNTANVIDMSGMFDGCSSLTSLDLSSFNTAKVIDMRSMFFYCRALTTICVRSGWTTDAVTASDGMFNNCTSLVGGQGTTYDANHVDATYAHIDGGPSNPGYLTELKEAYACYTPNNTTLTFYYDNLRASRPGSTYDMNGEFELPGWIIDWLDLENYLHPATQVVFDPSFADARPIATAYWFLGMRNLQSFSGLSYLNTSEVTNMSSMFNNCSGLTSLDLSSFNTAKVAYMESMFLRCSGLTSLNLSSFNTAYVGDMSGMFEDCTGLTSLDLSSFNTARAGFIPYMFNRCSNLTTIYAGSGWNLPADGYSEGMFKDCTSLVGGMGTTYDPNHVDKTYAHIDGGPSNPGYFTDANAATEAYAVYTEDNTTLTFYYDNQRRTRPGTAYGLNLGSEGMEWHETPYFFTQVVFDPSFADARPTTTSKWFYGMVNVQSITGLEYLNTDSVTDMSYMFSSCRNLLSVDMSHFNTSNVTNMYFMFANCRALTSLDVSGFNTDNVTTMECMFLYCMGLTSVDLSGFNNARVENTSNMFAGCYALTTIYADSGWSLPADNYSYAMFHECTNLVGGQGTTFDENHTDAEYARIDGGPSNPGYFTEKPSFTPGDVTGDGNVNISDVTTLINYLLSHDASGINVAAADVNHNGAVNISDVTTLINYLLSHSW